MKSAGVVTVEALARLARSSHDAADEFRRAGDACDHARQKQFLMGYAAALDSVASQIETLYELPF
jgi:hypothetical protein